MIELLEHALVPSADLAELATRLGGRGPIDTAFPLLPPTSSELGAQQAFWVSDMHGNRFQIETTHRLETAHSRMWVQNNLDMEQDQLVMLGDSLEQTIYPGVLSLLGHDLRSFELSVELVFTDRLGPKLAAYFSPQDMVHSEISETSNGRRMIFLNVDVVQDQDWLARLVAHELQHLIHWQIDSNETVWVQEGVSAFAEQLLDDDLMPRGSAYLVEPDLQPNAWPLEGDTARHYGAASLLINYLNDRFGPASVSALTQHPDNGFAALDELLLEPSFWDTDRIKTLITEDVFMDWGLANYLQLDSGPYSYLHRRDLPRTPAIEFVGRCKEISSEHTVSQFGFDYFRFRCDRAGTIEFSGTTSTKLLPAAAHSGQFFFWSNQGNLIDTRLTRQFDFTDAKGPLTLQFWTWYELEKGSDFVYLLASEDGQHWSFLETTSGDAVDDVSGTQLGFGYSGINRRREWSRQSVDLSEFAGKRVTLRFEYVTDTSRTGEGFLIDDLSVLETDYRADFEDGPDGWESEGFVRVTNSIPQQFRVSLVWSGSPVAAEHLTLDTSNRAIVNLDAGEEVVLVVMGASRHTRQPASYSLSLTH